MGAGFIEKIVFLGCAKSATGNYAGAGVGEIIKQFIGRCLGMNIMCSVMDALKTDFGARLMRGAVERFLQERVAGRLLGAGAVARGGVGRVAEEERAHD